MAFCQNCGTKIEPNTKRCSECGTITDITEEILKYYKNEEKRAKTHNWLKNTILFIGLALLFLIITLYAIIQSR